MYNMYAAEVIAREKRKEARQKAKEFRLTSASHTDAENGKRLVRIAQGIGAVVTGLIAQWPEL